MRIAVLCLALAVVLAGCGDDPEAADPPTVSVCAAVKGGEGAERGAEVVMAGDATPLRDLGAAGHPARLGFVLSEGDCSIFVLPPGRKAVEVDRGESLEVTGRVARLQPGGAKRIAAVLGEHPAGEITRGLPGSARIDAGAPYLDAFALTGEDLVEGTLRESK